MLAIYGRRNSFNVQKVLWLAGELGLEYTHIDKGGSFGGLEETGFRRMNPHGRVPVIDDDGTIVWESHAILRYLSASYGDTDWWPSAPRDRAPIDQWLDWSQCTLQPDFLNGIFWGWYRTPEAKRNMARVNTRIEAVARHMRLLDAEIDGKRFLLGDHPTLADIAITTNFYRYFEIDAIDKPAVANVRRWYDTVRKRQAYRDHVMVPFAELYGRLDY